MSFPLIFSFIDGAFEESRDFYKSPARSNPLVDDVFQTQMELGKRQVLKLKATALLDPVETDFSAIKGPKDEDVRGEIAKCLQATKRRPEKLNNVSYRIDSAVDSFNRQSVNRNVVFVHCAMGRSRSATCVIMFIMKRFGIAFEDVSLPLVD